MMSVDFYIESLTMGLKYQERNKFSTLEISGSYLHIFTQGTCVKICTLSPYMQRLPTPISAHMASVL